MPMTCKTTMIKVNKEKKTYFENIQFATWEQYSTRSRECSSQKLEISRWNLRGQIKSKWIYEIINFQKLTLKIWRISAMRVFIVHRAEILQIFGVNFWKIDDFINPFWLNLTFRIITKKIPKILQNLFDRSI